MRAGLSVTRINMMSSVYRHWFLSMALLTKKMQILHDIYLCFLLLKMDILTKKNKNTIVLICIKVPSKHSL